MERQCIISDVSGNINFYVLSNVVAWVSCLVTHRPQPCPLSIHSLTLTSRFSSMLFKHSYNMLVYN